MSTFDKIKEMFYSGSFSFTGELESIVEELDVVYEHHFHGYYPDVMTKDKTIVVECGHTQNADKILMYFRDGDVKECIQVPYPSDEDLEIKGFSFTPKNKLKEFLIFLQKEKLSKLKTIFFKR